MISIFFQNIDISVLDMSSKRHRLPENVDIIRYIFFSIYWNTFTINQRFNKRGGIVVVKLNNIFI